jgi:mRNA interferase MazF
MQKDFDNWNKKKKEINSKKTQENLFFYQREVWWCSIGVNVGVESDGKNESFERPVLIIKKFNGEMFWGLPTTSIKKVSPHYFKISHENGVSWVHLSQLKILSTKRMLRKVGMISESEFKIVLDRIRDYIKIEPLKNEGFSEAEATNT